MNYPITFRKLAIPVEALYGMRDALQLNPHYQRQGNIWSRRRQALLIDSILNGFHIPTMYWHALGPSLPGFDGRYRYAIVDGRQRLESIFGFIDGELQLTIDAPFLANPTDEFKNVSIDAIQARWPWLYSVFMRSILDVVIIDTEDIDLIEELFSRLNEGVPLSAAEKRNRGKFLAPLVSEFCKSNGFFEECLPFGNDRFRHFDLLAKFMRIEDRAFDEMRIPDLRKQDLDRLFDRLREDEDSDPDVSRSAIEQILNRVKRNLDDMHSIFAVNDAFLSSIGMVTVYYSIVRYLTANGMSPLEMSEVHRFAELRENVKSKDDDSYSETDSRVAEFAQYAQGTTSGTFLTERMKIFLNVMRGL